MAKITRRQFANRSVGLAAAGFPAISSARVGGASTGPSLPLSGERYEVEVPDTLDLAERAGTAINALTGRLDPEHNYEPYGGVRFHARPPWMFHGEDVDNWGKWTEALFEMRVMSGSEQNLEMDKKTLEGMLSNIEEDNLYWTTAKGRPWHLAWDDPEDYACLFSPRVMFSLMALDQLDQNPRWKKLIGRLADGLSKIAIRKEDYAYYPERPEPGGGYPRGGWRSTEELELTSVVQQRTLITNGMIIRAMCKWHAISGDERALDLGRRLTTSLIRPKWWTSQFGEQIEQRAMIGAQHAHFYNHVHSYLRGFHGLLEYAELTNNAGLKEFVREGYEYIRNLGISRIGLLGETCSVGDMVLLAVKLCDAGVDDYWEDVDQYVRNHLVETQFLRADLLGKVSEATPLVANKNPLWETTSDRMIQRNIGALTGDSTHTSTLTAESTICCVCNGLIGFYHAWEGIVRCSDNVAQVNLLLNRASPWLDINSYLPYEGKVVIKNKTARKLSVRIPRWVDKNAVRSSVNGKRADSFWLGNRLVFGSINQKDVVTIEFPVVETTEKYSNGWEGVRGSHVEWTTPHPSEARGWKRPEKPTVYTCQFKGNTLVDISPREERIGYPIYLRDHFKRTKAPVKKVTRYVSPAIIKL